MASDPAVTFNPDQAGFDRTFLRSSDRFCGFFCTLLLHEIALNPVSDTVVQKSAVGWLKVHFRVSGSVV